MWPLEIALWDVIGKISGRPLWQMLGGRFPRVRVYASSGANLPVEERIESVRRIQNEGFPAVKLRFHAVDPLEDIAAVRAIRDAAGSEMVILVDANQGWQMPHDTSAPWDYATALRVADALAECNVYWLEEPLPRHDYRGLADLRKQTKICIAGGEGNREFSELLEYLQHGSLDVYQPDVVWSTGISRARQIANRVRNAGLLYSPHTWGDGLVLLANLHVAAAVSNAPFTEYPYDPPHWTPAYRDFILPEPIVPDSEGYVSLPDTPGLGVSMNWAELEPLKFERFKYYA
jgi:L-alanine-DL-glutamate epimerase-like enolase superfamily enzyme